MARQGNVFACLADENLEAALEAPALPKPKRAPATKGKPAPAADNKKLTTGNKAAPKPREKAPGEVDWSAAGSQSFSVPEAPRGGGGGGGPRDGPRGAFRGGKRPFDRRSGTGRGYENKKGGSGKGNWGKPGAEVEVQEGPKEVETAPRTWGESTPAAAETSDEDKEKPAAAVEETVSPAEAPAAAEPTEPEVLQQSYSEYEKAQREQELMVARPGRKAGEGVDGSEWANTAPLVKRGGEDDDEQEQRSKRREGRKAKAPQRLVTAFRYEDGAPRGRGRGRGGPKNFGGRGGGGRGRGGAPRQDAPPARQTRQAPAAAPQMDADQFPALA